MQHPMLYKDSITFQLETEYPEILNPPYHRGGRHLVVKKTEHPFYLDCHKKSPLNIYPICFRLPPYCDISSCCVVFNQWATLEWKWACPTFCSSAAASSSSWGPPSRASLFLLLLLFWHRPFNHSVWGNLSFPEEYVPRSTPLGSLHFLSWRIIHSSSSNWGSWDTIPFLY